MKKISIHNYELFFVDYFDNVLNEKETRGLFEFLKVHPDLKDEFDSFENLNLTSENELILEGKSQLKKYVDKINIEHYIIADLENELSKEDKIEYTNFIAENALIATTIERYKKTILPLEVISFPNKETLKQKSSITLLWPYATAIAATVILFIILDISPPPQQYRAQTLNTAVNSVDTIFLDKKSIPIEKAPKKSTEQSIANVSSTKRTTIQLVQNNKVKRSEEKDSLISSTEKEVKARTKKTNPSIVKKNIILPNNEIKLIENLTIAEQKNIISNEEIPTPEQSTPKDVKTNLFESSSSSNKLIDKEFLITKATEKLNESKNIHFEQEEKETRKKTRLKIGKFEFYRNKGV